MDTTPVVLSIGGHDATGGAGIQADIETTLAHQCRACTLVSCLTTQDTHNVRHLYPQPVDTLLEQLHTLHSDIAPTIIKIGLLGSAELIQAIAPLLSTFNTPLVLDPILAAGGGYPLADSALIHALVSQLVPQTTLLTPNQAEALHLSGQTDLFSAMHYLLDHGCQHILLTSTDATQGHQVINTLYSQDGSVQDYTWPRLPHHYHGSGCTLATACACQIAQGMALPDAVQAAQAFTWHSLQQAERPGQGQYLPNRRHPTHPLS